MNGLGSQYITNVGLNYFIRAISGLETEKIIEGASGSDAPADGAASTSLVTEVDRDTAVVTWDGTNGGPIFTVLHEPTVNVAYTETGLFTTSNLMPFFYTGYMAGTIYGAGAEAHPGPDTLTNTYTLAFADSSE